LRRGRIRGGRSQVQGTTRTARGVRTVQGESFACNFADFVFNDYQFQAKSNEEAKEIKIQNSATTPPIVATSPNTAETKVTANQDAKIVAAPSKSLEKPEASEESQSCWQKTSVTIAGIEEKSKTTTVEVAKKPPWIIARLSL
jgi:hypothetical protein